MIEKKFQAAKFCAGCGHPMILMALERVLGELSLREKAVLGLDIGCSLLAINSLDINTFHTHHGRVTPTMMGFKRGNKDALVLAYTGDGGAYAIGLQYILHAALRDEPVTVIVVNNTVYGMTGGQQAPTTFTGQKTDTTPSGKIGRFLDGVKLVSEVAGEGAYVARGAINDINQVREMMKKALAAQLAGHFSLVEVLSNCPTNWKTRGKETTDFLQKNLISNFPVGEISHESGIRNQE
ncbi:MAG: thiamine pyrophosphate-dependent enzyme [Patescibacteria group bacterium]